jgi:hypothetical protein
MWESNKVESSGELTGRFAKEIHMRYSLFPFPSLAEAGDPDLREQLRVRGSLVPTRARGIANLELLEAVIDLLRAVPWQVHIDHCHEDDGDLRLAVVAPFLGRDVEKGDRVQAGFFLQNSESEAFQPFACERVYRVACENGYLVGGSSTRSGTILSTG